jgi:hypothetical protein
MITLQEPYAPRPIRYLGVLEPPGWRLKLYGISYERDLPREELIEAGRTLAGERIGGFAAGQDHYGVGFVGIHDGRGANFVFVDFWASENELHHHVFVSPHDRPEALEDVTETGLSACVWDLAVMGFERQAWLDSVLANPAGPDLDAYLACQMNADV